MTIVLVGSGRWGANILRDLLGIGVEVIVVDRNPNCRSMVEEMGASFTSNSEPCDLHCKDSIQAVIVATPASTHVEVIRNFAKLDVPIFSEKPLATNLSDARSLVDQLGSRLFVMHVWRYHAGVLAMKQVIESQELGPIRFIKSTRMNWTSPRSDVDSVWTLAPHDLSIAIELLGCVPPLQFASAELQAGRAVGMTCVLGKQPNFQLELSTRCPEKIRRLQVHFRDGVAWLDSDSATSLRIVKDNHQRGDGNTIEPQVEHLPFENKPPLRAKLEAIVEYLGGGPLPKSSAEEALQIVQRITEMRTAAGIS